MAKVTSPLFGFDASGALGKAIVYDKRGFVREYVTPSNPQTDPQANIRTPFRALAACVKATGAAAKNDIKGISPEGYRWSSHIIGEALGKELAAWNHSMSTFDALTSAEQDDWVNQAQHIHINPAPVSYDINPIDKLPGRAMWAYANALARNGLGGDEPDGTNASTWANYIAH